MEETIFHKIVRGELPCHKIWEDDKFLAFLSIFPNTEGVTVSLSKHLTLNGISFFSIGTLSGEPSDKALWM